MTPALLRPLSIGEIFDRAITLYFRNAVPVSIVMAFAIVPTTLCEFFMDKSQAGTWAQILSQVQHPSSTATALPQYSVWFYAVIAAGLLLTPFTYTAIASLVSQVYAERVADWREAALRALRRTGAILATLILEAFIMIGALVAGIIPFMIVTIAIVALGRGSPAMVGVGMIFMGIAAVAYFLLILLAYLMVALAFDGLVVEDARVPAAIGGAFLRVFSRREIGRAVLICLSLVAIELGLMLVLGFSDVLLASYRQPMLEAGVQGVVSLFSSGFLAVLIAVYYFDVRVRREGLDVCAAIDRLESAQAPGV